MLATLWRRLGKGPRRPGWSFLFEFVIELLRRDWAELAGWPFARVRRELAQKPMPKTASKRVVAKERTLRGVRVLELAPDERRSEVTILYLHGGSYLFGSPETHLDIGARHAIAAKATVIVPDYRLAPEHPYPAALEDALRCWDALVEDDHLAPSAIAVTGESAGGNLALVLAIALRDRGGPLPRAVGLASPWLDLSGSRPSTRTMDDDYGTREMLLHHARAFAGDLPLDDPRVSPLFADLAGLPPLWVQAGSAERLFDEARELVKAAVEAGVDAHFEALPEMPHAVQLLAEWCPKGQKAIEGASAFLVRSAGGAAVHPVQSVAGDA